MKRTFKDFLQNTNLANEEAQAAIEQAMKHYENEEYHKAYDKATEGFSIAISLDPNDAGAYRSRGYAYRMKDQYDQAISDLTEAIRLDPNDAEAYKSRGDAYNGKFECDMAINDYSEAIRLDPNDADAYISRGDAYWTNGLLGDADDMYDQAINDYSEAIRLDPNNAIAYIGRGNAYNDKGQYDQAINDYSESIRLDPQMFITYENRGKVYKKMGQREQAIQDFEKTLSLYPDYESAKELLQETQCDLGTRYYKGDSVPQDYAKAAEWYGKAAEQGNTDAKEALDRLKSDVGAG